MTRIIGGVARGRPIRTPPGDSTRPTADRVREALFSSLESTYGTLRGLAVLDVFAGSGAVGLEAASRGAERVTAVERNRSVSALVAANARALGLEQVEVVTVAAAAIGGPGARRAFDVAYLDPPYDLANEQLSETLAGLAAAGWLAEAATVVVERSRRSPPWTWPAGFRAGRERRYGDTILWYGRWESPHRAVAGEARSDEES
jgi:16S rRNA (guanine966-N2)-methyltransferase